MGTEEGQGEPEARRRAVQAQDEQLIPKSEHPIMKTHSWFARLATVAALTISVTSLAAAQDADAQAPAGAPAAAAQTAAVPAAAERQDPNAGSIRVLVL